MHDTVYICTFRAFILCKLNAVGSGLDGFFKNTFTIFPTYIHTRIFVKFKIQEIEGASQIFENFMLHKPYLRPHEVPQKIWARSVQPFWRLLDTNKQTDKQTDKPNLYIDENIST